MSVSGMNRSMALVMFALVIAAPVLSAQEDATSRDEQAADAAVPGPAAPPGVTKQIVRDRGLYGVVYAPADLRNLPAVLVIGGSIGGVDGPAYQAASLSSNGYVALALAYFGVDGLPSTLEHVPLEYFDVAIEWLRQHPSIDPDRIALLGSSRGAEAVLLIASRNDEVWCVIAASPSGIVWRGFDIASPADSEAAWSLSGIDLPFVLPDAAILLEGRIGAAYQARLESAYRRPEVQIEVETINGPILLISGREDQQWPSAEMAGRIVERLERSGFRFAIEHKSYPDAGHLVFIGDPDNAGLPNPSIAWSPLMGGTEAGNRAAWADSWSQVLQFLAEPSGSAR